MNEIVIQALEQEKAIQGTKYKATLAHKLDVGSSTFAKYLNGFVVSETMEMKIQIGCAILVENPQTNKVTQSMRAEWYLKNKKKKK